MFLPGGNAVWMQNSCNSLISFKIGLFWFSVLKITLQTIFIICILLQIGGCLYVTAL